MSWSTRQSPRSKPGELAHHAVYPIFDEQIVWDQECEGVSRVSWSCGYFLPPDTPSARALVPIFNAAIGRWQEKSDLGLTCEGGHGA